MPKTERPQGTPNTKGPTQTDGTSRIQHPHMRLHRLVEVL